MDHAILVNEKIQEGAHLLRAMQHKGVMPKAAMWFYDSDAETWKLIVASEKLDEDYLSSYRILGGIIRELGLKNLNVSEVQLTKTSDPLIQGIASMQEIERTAPIDFVKSRASNIYRMTKSRINGIYVDDALVYPVSINPVEAQQPVV